MMNQRFDRRNLLKLGAGAVFVSVMPVRAFAASGDLQKAQRDLFADRPITEGRVSVTLPPIAENGYSVPITIDVDTPMTEGDHVSKIYIFSPRNPVPEIARFHLGSQAGRARVATRIRLGGTQAVQVIAEMNDGALWSGTRETVVTLAACVVM